MREDEIRSLSFDVQSDENAFLEVVKVPESKSISLNDLDEIVSRFQLGVGVGQFQGIENLVSVLQESPKDGLKNWVNIRNNLLNQIEEMISLLFLKVKEQKLVKLIFPFLKPYSSQLMISGSLCQLVSNLNSLSLRMTVEVENESLWAISVMACFSTNN